jgi:hypothetical protein
MDESPQKLIEIFNKSDAFFKEALDEAVKNNRVEISELATFYLLNLLVRGCRTPDPASYMGKQTVAEEYAKEMFRDAGDHALLIAGVWWESLIRKVVKTDYFIGLGAKAYKRESECTSNDDLSDMFEELSIEFGRLSGVLTKAIGHFINARLSNRDVLRIYEKWLRTRKPELLEELLSLGINPAVIKSTKQ